MNKLVTGKRIQELRKENRLSQEKFGTLLAVSQDTVSLWETGKSFPPAESLIAMSKTFSVSVDYILGLSDI